MTRQIIVVQVTQTTKNVSPTRRQTIETQEAKTLSHNSAFKNGFGARTAVVDVLQSFNGITDVLQEIENLCTLPKKRVVFEVGGRWALKRQVVCHFRNEVLELRSSIELRQVPAKSVFQVRN